jgi:DNA-binding HxlR family transcriptional regulator
VVAILADKWCIPVIHSLARGKKRTGVLRRELVGVSQKMLTQTLRRLEKHGLIERAVFPVVPPRVEYRLTALGESINEPLAHLCEWTKRYGTALQQSVVETRRRDTRTDDA